MIGSVLSLVGRRGGNGDGENTTVCQISAKLLSESNCSVTPCFSFVERGTRKRGGSRIAERGCWYRDWKLLQLP